MDVLLELEVGRAAYGRFCAVVRLRPQDGQPHPPYDELPTFEKLGWAAAGQSTILIDDTAGSCAQVSKTAFAP